MNKKNLRLTALALPVLLIGLAACGEEDLPMVPGDSSEISLNVAMVDFGTEEVNFGESGASDVVVQNTGTAALSVSAVTIEGSDAADFKINSSTSFTVSAGGTEAISVTYNPSVAGASTATLRIASNASDNPSITVALMGNGAESSYRQVDRMGIPALNTVFNHPPDFSKTDYNLATPDADDATYTGLFETVLGAVANADPVATADLLLPDELPVSLGASPTSFATLTGRALADDAVDVALTVTVGVAELQSDNVDANDKAFLLAFPYLAAPH